MSRITHTHTKGMDRLTSAHHPRALPQTADGELSQGRRGPEIGFLADSIPERRDGDKDTVVAEQRPRKADAFQSSPAPVPERHRQAVAGRLGMVEAKMLTQHKFTPDEKRAIKRTLAREK